MCDPVTATAAALVAGGTVLNNQTQNRAIRAQNRANNDAFMRSRNARLAEQQRQEGFQQEAQARVDRNVQANTRENQEQTLAAILNERMRQTDAVLGPADVPDFLSGQQGGTAEIQREIAGRVANEAADARRRAAALAKLSSFGGRSSAVARGNAATAADLGVVGNLRRGSLGVADQEQSIPAVQVRPGSTLLGDLMIGAGQVGMFAGGSGWNPFQSGGPAVQNATFAKSVGLPMRVPGGI